MSEPPSQPSSSLKDKLLPVGCIAGVFVLIALAWLVFTLPSRSVQQPRAVPDDPTSRLAHQPNVLHVLAGGVPRPLASGEEIPIADDLLAQATLSRSSEGRFARSLDVFLHHGSGAGLAVEGAVVRASVHMLEMDHGSFRQAAVPSGAGHYLLPMQFAMLGDWQFDLEIETPEAHKTIQLAVDLAD